MKYNSIKNEGSCPPPDESSSLLSTHLLLSHFTFSMAVLSHHPSFWHPNCTNYGAPCYAVSSSFYLTYCNWCDNLPWNCEFCIPKSSSVLISSLKIYTLLMHRSIILQFLLLNARGIISSQQFIMISLLMIILGWCSCQKNEYWVIDKGEMAQKLLWSVLSPFWCVNAIVQFYVAVAVLLYSKYG